ncbi:hypothetical protein AC579_1036 [Pseudocercospora musae]|uniref:Uncharacterized protein n=1 Tax=Pseudocercospora musae TaxID=113226 RepID=A0A139I6G9_9PEZI|nr:hypothetical protein AC579_1036 [Pseudocercospora musae]
MDAVGVLNIDVFFSLRVGVIDFVQYFQGTGGEAPTDLVRVTKGLYASTPACRRPMSVGIAFARPENGLLYKCREGCKDLLTEPNLPRHIRVHTLHILSTILTESGAEQCLKDAAEVLSQMDATDYQVQLLKSDNDKMLADLQTWRIKEGLVGADVEEALIDREQTGTGKTEAPGY